jgi:TonB family protein
MIVAAAIGLLAGLFAVGAQDSAGPRPLPGNPSPKYPDKAQRARITGTVTFRASVNAEGFVISVDILTVPQLRFGFEVATREAVMRWRFQPGRVQGRLVDAVYDGSINFVLQPKDEIAIRQVVAQAFENWLHPAQGDENERAPKIRTDRETANSTALLESRLEQALDRGSAPSLSVDAIQFEGDDAWVTSSLHSQSRSAASFRTLMVRNKKEWLVYFPEVIPGTATAALHDSSSTDTEPVPVSRPPSPSYPLKAQNKGVNGEVVLQIVVELDGSTTVWRVTKSLPYCNVAAIEHARRWRWKPGVKNGEPVRTAGVLTVTFEMFQHR